MTIVVLDHTENWIFHGLPDEEHEWSLDPVSLTSPKWAIECIDCQHCFKPLPHEQASRIAICPNCGKSIQLEEPGDGQVVERCFEHDKTSLWKKLI